MSESRQPPVNTLKEIGIPVLKMIGVVAVTAVIVVLIIQLLKPHQNSNPAKSGVDQPQKFKVRPYLHPDNYRVVSDD
jgi:hypothetical protein